MIRTCNPIGLIVLSVLALQFLSCAGSPSLSLRRPKTCSQAMEVSERWVAQAVDRTCRRWVREGVVTWDQIESDIEQREWYIYWAWPGFDAINRCGPLPISCSYGFVRAMTVSASDRMEMRLRDPADTNRIALIEDIVHETSHFVLFAGGIHVSEHHPMMEERDWIPN